jgi:arginase
MSAPLYISLIFSPYHVGIRDHGPGAGPTFLRSRGLVEALRETHVTVRELEIEPVDDFEGDIGRSFELFRRTSKLVAQERDRGSFPIVLSGNCSASVGVAAGLSAGTEVDLGCVWFDAHDDFNTPETVMSGYFDSMPIAMLMGQCWKGLLATVPGHRTLSMEKLVHVGMRDVTAAERMRVNEAGFDVIWGRTDERVDFTEQLGQILGRKRLGATMVHLDLDCLDASLGKVNKFSAPVGLLEEDLKGCLQKTVALTEPVSLTVASFDPSFDGADRIADTAIRVVKAFVAALVSKGLVASRSSR